MASPSGTGGGAATRAEVKRLRMEADMGNVHWFAMPGRFGRLRAILYNPFYRLWFRLNRRALYRAWKRGFEAGQRQESHYDRRPSCGR